MPAAYSDDHKQRFLDALAKTGIIATALGCAEIKSRTTIKNWVESDPQFAAAYEEAIETSNDTLEAEARRRAEQGVVRKRYDKDGNLISEEIAYSDSLMLALLKANRPDKFAERTKADITSSDRSMSPAQPEAAAARIAAMLEEAKRRRENTLSEDDDELFS